MAVKDNTKFRFVGADAFSPDELRTDLFSDDEGGYLNLPTLDDAVNTLKPWWPGLFDGDTPRLLACGIRDVLLEDVAQRNIPLSHKKLRRALKAITRSESYLCAMKAGACRYDTEGYVTEHISQEEEAYAAERLDKIRRQNRIKAELQAVLDEK